MERIVIIGAGGHAREVLDIFEALNAPTPTYDVLGWLVEPAHGAPGTRVRERPILGDLDWLSGRAADVRVVCAVGDPALRLRLVARAAPYGVRFATAIHPRAVLSSLVSVGPGGVVAAGSVLTSDIRLGAHVHINTGCTVAHDVTMDDFATLSPGTHLAGGVVIGAGACIGTGASVAPRVRIGAWSIVGAGCAVVADVPPDSTVVGVPGRTIAQRAPGWHVR
jgi:sugar O-acyltransferase (sialic acid O-acetyltransferase NeuD family)